MVDKGKVIEFLHLPIGGIVSDIEPHEMAAAEIRLDEGHEALAATCRGLSCTCSYCRLQQSLTMPLPILVLSIA